MLGLKDEICVAHLLDAQDITNTDTKSKYVDLANCTGAMFLVNLGAATPLSGAAYLLPTLQESATTADTDFTTVATTDVDGAFTTIDSQSEDQTTQWVGYIGSKRYVRVLLNVTGSLSNTLVSVDAVVRPAHQPQTSVTTGTAA